MYTGEFNEALSSVISFTRRRPDDITNLLKHAFDALMDKEYDKANDKLKEAAVRCYEIIWSLQHTAVRVAYDKIIHKLQNKPLFSQETADDKKTLDLLRSNYEDYTWSSARTSNEIHDMIGHRKRQVNAGFEIIRMAGMGIESFEIVISKREKRSNRVKRILASLVSAALVSIIVFIIAG